MPATRRGRLRYGLEKSLHISGRQLQGRLSLMNCRGQGGHVRDAILSRVRSLKPDFVIVDPRYKLMRPDEDENTGSGLIGILNLLDAIAEENAAVMIVSHDKKGDVKGQDIRDRGADVICWLLAVFVRRQCEIYDIISQNEVFG